MEAEGPFLGVSPRERELLGLMAQAEATARVQLSACWEVLSSQAGSRGEGLPCLRGAGTGCVVFTS